MSMPKKIDLRDPLGHEWRPLPPPIVRPGFVLQPTGQKVFIPLGCPVQTFDVVDLEERIGFGSVILGPDTVDLFDVGHVCAVLAEKRCTADLLFEVARALVNHAFESGMANLRIVVPVDDLVSTEACQALGPSSPPTEAEFRGRVHLTFRYSRG